MRSFARGFSPSRLFGSLLALALCGVAGATPGFAVEGLRRIEAPRFGVAVMAPGGWRLMEWSENDRAFVLHLPQEKGSSEGYVRCELASAPERLADFQKRHRDRDEREQRSGDPRRKLVSDVLEETGDVSKDAAAKDAVSRDAAAKDAVAKDAISKDGVADDTVSKNGVAKDAVPLGGAGDKDAAEGQRLVTVWELLDENVEPGEDRRFEVASRIVRQETLYTFTLITDEAHFAAYRADFDDLVASAKLTPPEAGLTAAADGYWLQPQFQFALRPPAGWKPAFGASDRALWFAHRAAHGVFVDSISVAASARAPLDLAMLREAAGATIDKLRPASRLVSCQIVAQGATSALETILTSERDGVAITIVERRFTGARRNYEIRVACETATFKRQEAEIRKALESFRELADSPPAREL